MSSWPGSAVTEKMAEMSAASDSRETSEKVAPDGNQDDGEESGDDDLIGESSETLGLLRQAYLPR